MKRIFFLFALLLGIGISSAMTSGMQPPGQDYVFSATYIISAPNVVYLDVETGSSGGMADWCINCREVKLQPLNWYTTLGQHRTSNKNLLGYTQNKRCNIPVFAINCNYKFPLI